MALKYLRSAAAGTGTGADWTNAYTTLVLAFAGMAAGDTLYVADDHAETQASTMTLTSPGTASNPVRVLCVNTHVTTPPTALATSATITTTGSFIMAFAAGFAYIYGITFSAASGAVSSGGWMTFALNSSNWGWTLDNCKLRVPGTGGNPQITVGVASGSAKQQWVKWINTTVKFGGAVTSSGVYSSAGRFSWVGGSLDATGTIPTTLLWGLTGTSGYVEVSGVDLSASGTGKNLVNPGANPCAATFYIRNCKLGASVNVLGAAISGPGSFEVILDNCDSGATNTRMEHYKYQGSILGETTKVRASSGASDGTTTLSHNLTTLATPTLFSPLEGPWMEIWNDTSGASKTVTVELCTENVSLFNDDCWLEVEYLGTSGNPESVYTSSRVADVFATHAALTTSAVSWNGFTTAAPQKLSLTFTPQSKGLIRARVCVAKASTSVYVDPQIAVTSGPSISRSYAAPGGLTVNETATSSASGMLFTPNLDGV